MARHTQIINDLQENINQIQKTINLIQIEKTGNSLDNINTPLISLTESNILANDIASCYHLLMSRFHKVEREKNFLRFLNDKSSKKYSGKFLYSPRFGLGLTLKTVGISQSSIKPVSFDLFKRITKKGCLFELKIKKTDIKKTRWNPKRYLYPCEFEKKWICIN